MGTCVSVLYSSRLLLNNNDRFPQRPLLKTICIVALVFAISIIKSVVIVITMVVISVLLVPYPYLRL